MRASNYTPVDAVKKLHEELDKLFAGKTFSGQGKNKPLNIFDFEFPTDFGNDEDVVLWLQRLRLFWSRQQVGALIRWKNLKWWT